MTRPSSAVRGALQGQMQALSRNGHTPTAADLVAAMMQLGETNERQADALALRLWGYPLYVLRAVAERGRLAELEPKPLTLREVGAALVPPVSHVSANDLIGRAIANVLACLVIEGQASAPPR